MEHQLQAGANVPQLLDEPNQALMVISAIVAGGIFLMLLALASISY